MSLCGRPPYQKGQRLKKKSNEPSAKQRKLWDRMRDIGCIVCSSHRGVAIHHCGTGAGGRKNHDFIIPLCYVHHQGELGIDRREYGASEKVIDWESLFGTERELYVKTMQALMIL